MMETRRQAVLVYGPESSGTRFITSVFIAAGCTGDAGHGQRFDLRLPHEPRVVWRRSFPHNHAWPDARVLINRLRETGYEVSVAVASRDWYCMANSQVTNCHVRNHEKALENIRRAYNVIFAAITDTAVPFVLVNLESMMQHKQAAVERLLDWFGLEAGEVQISDSNEKHFLATNATSTLDIA